MKIYYKPRLYALISDLPDNLRPLYASVYDNATFCLFPGSGLFNAYQKVEKLFGNFYIAFNPSDTFYVNNFCLYHYKNNPACSHCKGEK